jgi:type IV secretory pathway VirB10-like protein
MAQFKKTMSVGKKGPKRQKKTEVVQEAEANDGSMEIPSESFSRPEKRRRAKEEALPVSDAGNELIIAQQKTIAEMQAAYVAREVRYKADQDRTQRETEAHAKKVQQQQTDFYKRQQKEQDEWDAKRTQASREALLLEQQRMCFVCCLMCAVCSVCCASV